MARRCNQIGRVRIRLWELLQEAGFSIPGPEDFWMQEGAYRGMRMDLARWGADWKGLTLDKSHVAHHTIFSWDTMTECVKLGIVFSDDGPGRYEIYRNEEPHEKTPA